MTPSPQERRLEALIHLLLDGDLPAEANEEFAVLLRTSPEARRRYLHALAVHNALSRIARDQGEIPAFVPPAKVIALPRRPAWKIPLAVAACALLAVGLAFLLRRGDSAPPAVLSGMTSATWGGALALDHEFFPGQVHDLTGGFAEVSYRNGVKVVLEAPCRFEVTGGLAMTVSHGRASVKVPKGTSGFILDTPGGRIVDLGTEFGVAVGSGDGGPVVLSEVFDGAIEIPAGDAARVRLEQGEARAIVKENGGTRLASTLVSGGPVGISNPARQLPRTVSAVSAETNLALGKPVFSPSYWAGREGEVFPPDNLTDGRLNDTGSPGDWSFWLAPNRVGGEFTVDLLQPVRIGRVEMQNTRNRNHADRGMRHFAVLVSLNNRDFTEVTRGELPVVAKLPVPGADIPFLSFPFAPVETRYVKIVCLDYYRNESRPASNPNEGGGLNEIRVFSP